MGAAGDSEIPLPLSFFYLFNEVETGLHGHFLALRQLYGADLG